MPTRVEIEENRRKWLAALKSGEYKQTRGYLCLLDWETREPLGYCCLGVAHEVLGAQHHAVESQRETARWRVYEDSAGHASKDFLTPGARDALGFRVADPRINFPAHHVKYGQTVADLNDDRWDFEQIVWAIEQFGWHPEDEQ